MSQRVPHRAAHRSGARRTRLAAGLAIAWAVLAIGPGVRAESDPVSASEARSAADPVGEVDPDGESRRVGYGIALGYGAGIAPRDEQRGRDVADVQTLSFEPGMRIRIAQAGDGSSWVHGRLDGTLSGLVLFNFDPQFGAGGGVLAGLRYLLRPTARLQPWCGGAIGAGGIDFDLQSQADGLAFFIQAGFGARWRLDEQRSLSGGFRWLHVSNAQTESPNAGIGTLGFTLGIDFW